MESAWANKASSLPSAIVTQFKYDVFLSFHGDDTRKSFTSHLLAALDRHGFHTFIDDKKLKRGEYIDHELLKAIEESRISLVVLSNNYASSRWCLDELVKIMECRKKLQQIVFPIFHGVEPSDVRALKGSLVETFARNAKHFNEGPGSKVEIWKEALTQVANLSGWDLPKVDNGDEAHLIRKAIEEVQNKLDTGLLHVACREIGLESRLRKLKLLLRMETDDVRIVAIYGMGGIGKTTLSRKLFNLVQHKFEGSSFLANIRETSKLPNGPVVLQEQLLSDILRSGTHNLRNYHQGIEVIKRRAFCRKILLILDDVDDVQQLKQLAIDRDSLASGSRVIITTRDISSLNWLKVDEIYPAEKLNKYESLELFNWHCFKEDHPTEDQVDLSNQVVAYAGGLPLALEVLGSFLCGKSIPEWRSAISKLRKIPPVDIQEKLRISFDSLSDEVKELFLDMSCFFVGTCRNFTVKILASCNSFAEIGIRVLSDQCLVKFDCNQIVMHDLLRDMGREIVRQESVKEPGRRSRLWYHEDALEVLVDATGSEAVEGLSLNFHELNEVQANSKAFEKMNRLWLLHLNHVHLKEGYEHISKKLLWLCWNGFPFKCLPSNLHMENLVTLDVSYSSLKKAWNGSKILVKLKFLYLSHCYYLIETPDFSGLNNLEELWLNDCIRLVEVDKSIRFLNKLLVLDMKNCKRLRNVPSSIWMLKSLKSLDLSGCSMLGKYFGLEGSPSKSQSLFLTSWNNRAKRVDSIGSSLSPVLAFSCIKDLSMKSCNLSCLPNEVGNLLSLETLDLSENNLPTLTDTICNLTRLKRLTLKGCNMLHLPNEMGRLDSLEILHLAGNSSLKLSDSLCNLTRLKELNLNNCNLTHLPNGMGMLKSLTRLHLENSNVCGLPDSFSDLASLERLYLSNCGRLQSLPEFPASLYFVDASNCPLLERIPAECNLDEKVRMCLEECNVLAKNNFVNNAMKRLDQYKESALQGGGGIYRPTDEDRILFHYRYAGSRFSLMVPPLVTQRTAGWMLKMAFKSHNEPSILDGFHITVDTDHEEQGEDSGEFIHDIVHIDRDNMALLYLRSGTKKIIFYGEDEMEIEVNPENSKKMVNLMYEDNKDNAVTNDLL